MPRWRTMIEPAVTSWPSPALTPSRWPTLSRPFLSCSQPSCVPSRLLVLLRGAGPLRRGRLGSAVVGLRAGSPWSVFGGRRPWPRPPWRAAFAAGPWSPAWPRRRPSAVALGLGGWSPWRSAFSAAGLRRPAASAPAAASFAASSASLAAWAAAASSRRWRSVLASSSAFFARLRGALAVERDVADAQDRQLLAMALLDAAARLGPVLEAR